jgi:LPS export ABC transporter protein LptC
MTVMRRPLRGSSANLLFVVLSGLLPVAVSLASEAGQAASPPSPELTLRQVHMIETRGGSKLWELWADQVEVHEREGFAILTRVRRPVEAVLFSSRGTLRCTAGRARVDMQTKDVRLEGEILARSEDGAELRTETLRWVASTRRIQTDQPVTVTRGTLQSHGLGLEAETDLEQVRIFQNITSYLRPPPAPGAPGNPSRAAGRTPARSVTP